MNREELEKKIALCVDEIERVMQIDKTLKHSFTFDYDEQHEVRVSIAPRGQVQNNSELSINNGGNFDYDELERIMREKLLSN